MNPKFLGVVASGLLLTTSVFASSSTVATVTAVSGDVKVETLQGKRMSVAPNMQLAEGSTLIVLKGNVNLQYKSTGCKQVYTPNTLVSINENSQCTAGQPMNVGAAGARGNSAGMGAPAANRIARLGISLPGWAAIVIGAGLVIDNPGSN